MAADVYSGKLARLYKSLTAPFKAVGSLFAKGRDANE